jgi:hypothetical protein
MIGSDPIEPQARSKAVFSLFSDFRDSKLFQISIFGFRIFPAATSFYFL